MNSNFCRLRDFISQTAAPSMISKESAAIWCYLMESQRSLGIQGNFLEIGAFRGHATSVMALHADKSEAVFLIDTDIKENEIRSNISKLTQNSDLNLTFILGDSLSVQKTGLLQKHYASFRWIHVDGEHSYDAVMSDLDMAVQTMKPEGLIVVDDFFNIASACITDAVFTYLRLFPHKVCMPLCGFNKAYIASPRFFGKYRDLTGPPLIEFLETNDIQATLSENAHSTEIAYRSVLKQHGGMRCRGIGFMKETFT